MRAAVRARPHRGIMEFGQHRNEDAARYRWMRSTVHHPARARRPVAFLRPRPSTPDHHACALFPLPLPCVELHRWPRPDHLTGRISDAHSKEPLAFVPVNIVGTKQGHRGPTSMGGSPVVVLPAVLRFSYVGYERGDHGDDRCSADQVLVQQKQHRAARSGGAW